MIEGNSEEFGHPKQIKLLKSQTKLKRNKIRRIFWHDLLIKDYYLESRTYHLILLFYSYRKEKKLLPEFPCLHQNKFLEPGDPILNAKNYGI